MKKVAVIPAVVLAALCTFTGCKKEEVEKVIAPLVSDGQTTESTEEAQEEKDPLIPEIDTSVELQSGSRVSRPRAAARPDARWRFSTRRARG